MCQTLHSTVHFFPFWTRSILSHLDSALWLDFTLKFGSGIWRMTSPVKIDCNIIYGLPGVYIGRPNKCRNPEPAQTTPELPTGGKGTGKRDLWRCKGGPEKALLVKGRI